MCICKSDASAVKLVCGNERMELFGFGNRDLREVVQQLDRT